MRSYDQYCGLARALDVVGDRWTLLIVRELLVAPRRYGALLADLPGIATNLLADRLRHLEAAGVLQRTGTGPTTRYALTARGRELEPAVLALASWGGPTLVDRGPTDTFRPHWLVLGLRALLGAAADPRLTVTVDLEVEGGTVHVAADHGRVATGPGAADPVADVVLAGDAPTVLGVVAGLVPFDDLAVGRGPARAVRRARRLLAPAAPRLPVDA